MKYLGISLIYISFFGFVAFIVWHFDSFWALLLIFFMPKYSEKESKKSNDSENQVSDFRKKVEAIRKQRENE